MELTSRQNPIETNEEKVLLYSRNCENIACKHVKHVSNNDITADCFTKPLSGLIILK